MSEHPFELADTLDDDKPYEECGVFGVWGRDADVARMAFFALYSLQHRGQESAGIATWDDQQVWGALADGADSLVVMTGDALWAIRDPLGLRPLCIGATDLGGDGEASSESKGYLVASESYALGTVGARHIGEVAPGEIVRIDDRGIERFPGLPETAPRRQQALCVFEYVYFARPDSVLEDQTIHHVRQRLGARLWEQAPVEADVVIGVPDSATPAAIGYSLASGIPYSEGLTKNRYIGRTFIQPNDQLRRSGVRLKYNPLSANLRGKRVVMVDDSIVRGNTCGPLVKLLRDGGASEVHVRVSSPPVRHPCFMGVDMATYDQLIAHRMDVEGIRQHIGADSLAYLEHSAMMEAVGEAGHTSDQVSRGHTARSASRTARSRSTTSTRSSPWRSARGSP